MSEEMEKQGTKAIAAFDFGDDAGLGYEHQSAADVQIPMILTLQFMSPQVTKRVKCSVTDRVATAGDLYHTGTGRVYDGTVGFGFVPGTTRHMVARWVPRKEGGGFRGHLMPEDPVVLQAKIEAERRRAADPKERFGKLMSEDGLQLVETFYVYGVTCTDDGIDGMAMLAFASMKIKAYRAWQTRLRGHFVRDATGKFVRPPPWSNHSRITTFLDNNDLGEFYVPQIRPANPRGLTESVLQSSDERYQAARGVALMMKEGSARPAYEAEQAADGDQEGEAPY